MAMDQHLLAQQVQKPRTVCCRRRRPEPREFFIGDEEPAVAAERPRAASGGAAELYGDTSMANWAQEKAALEISITQAKRLAMAGFAVALAASCGFLFLWLTAAGPGLPSPIGRTELAFDYFEETLKQWDSQRTAETFADNVIIRFYNSGTGEKRVFVGKAGALEVLAYATGLGCAKLQDTVVVREVDEAARMVYVAWEYPKSLSNFCRPSAETYFFDEDYKILRLNALVYWRNPRNNATLVAFNYFEWILKTWDLDATSLTFATDAVITFYNQGTGELREFSGRPGAKGVITYALSLGCARQHDDIRVRKVDEETRSVYIAWDYPSNTSSSGFDCGSSAELYLFDEDYKISRLDALVDWRRASQEF